MTGAGESYHGYVALAEALMAGGHGEGHDLRSRPRVGTAYPKIIQQSTRGGAAISMVRFLAHFLG